MSDSLNVGQKLSNLFEMELTGFEGIVQGSVHPDLRLNSRTFRCDEFKKNHEGKHILFSGCSVAYGQGLLEDETWAKKLYYKIKQETSVSGFFNLAVPGTGICDIVSNVFKYINNFNKPDLIFILLPPISRRYVYIPTNNQNHEKNIYHAVYKNCKTDEYYPIVQVQSFHYLMFLEMFCKSNDIKLYYFSYDHHFPIMDLNRFFKMDKNVLDANVEKFCIRYPDNEYAIRARDGTHFGEAYHEFWANLYYSLYKQGS